MGLLDTDICLLICCSVDAASQLTLQVRSRREGSVVPPRSDPPLAIGQRRSRRGSSRSSSPTYVLTEPGFSDEDGGNGILGALQSWKQFHSPAQAPGGAVGIDRVERGLQQRSIGMP